MTQLATKIEHAILDVCREFANATGWPLEFIPVGAIGSEGIESTLRNDPNCCWFTDITDGVRRLGYLHIQLPETEASDRSFLTICDLADLFARLLGRLASTSRSLASRTQDVSTLVDIGRSVPRDENVVRALQQLLRAVVQLTGFRTAVFFLLTSATTRLRLRAYYHLEPRQVPHPQRDLTANPPDIEALARGNILLRRDASPDDAAWLPPDAAIGLCVPVESEVGPLGTLWAYDRRMRTPSNREIQVIESISTQVATVLERVVLLEESKVQHRLKGELRLASQNQPQSLICDLPTDCGFEAAVRCTSRHEVGGDLFELIPISRNRTVLAIGDASGDSIPAAMVMSAIRGALRAMTEDENDLQTECVMGRLNRTLYGMTPPHQFMSLLYGILDPMAMMLTYTNAGHPTPFLIRDGKPYATHSHGMLVGVLDDTKYGFSVLDLQPEDLLLCFSDGISEAMNSDRQMFRSEGILAAAQSRLPASAEDVLSAIWHEMERHCGHGQEPDDRTLLVIKMKSPATTGYEA